MAHVATTAFHSARFLARSTFQDAPSRSRGGFRPDRVSRSRSGLPKGAGKAGRRRHPQVRGRQERTRGGPQVCRSPGLPCADGFNGVLRALLGERCTIAPVASRLIDARTRSGRRITARFDARTSGVGTTRLLRPRTAWPQRQGLGVRTPDHRPNRCDRAVSYARRAGTHGRPPCPHAHRAGATASTAPRPASRDDREAPLWQGRDDGCMP